METKPYRCHHKVSGETLNDYINKENSRLQSLLKGNPGYVICPLCEGSGKVYNIVSFYTAKCPLCEGKYIIDWVTNIMNKSEYKKFFMPF